MKKEVIGASGGAVVPITIAGGFAFISGQIAWDLDSGEVHRGTIQEEARMALSNLKTMVERAGATLEDVVKCDVFLSSMEDFDGMNEVYKEFFGTRCPPSRCAVALGLWGGMKIEVGAIVKL